MYFIWPVQKGPIECGGRDAGLRYLGIPIYYVAKDGKGEKFRTAVEMSVQIKGEEYTYKATASWSQEGQAFQGGPHGATGAFFQFPVTNLAGASKATIHLVRAAPKDAKETEDTETKPEDMEGKSKISLHLVRTAPKDAKETKDAKDTKNTEAKPEDLPPISNKITIDVVY